MQTGNVLLQQPAGMSMFRSFRHRNYRLYFAGQSISLMGTWIEHTTIAWLVYRLTDSSLLLGLTSFAALIPSFLFTSVAGVFADRLDRRRLLLCSQTCAMLISVTLVLLAGGGIINIRYIIALSFALGMVNAFDVPAREAFVADIVEKSEDMGNAIALNSSVFHAARLIGPAVAGVLIAAFGETVCFAVNAVSFLAVIAALLCIKLKSKEKTGRGRAVLVELREGFNYARGSLTMRNVLALVGFVSLAGMPYMVLLPVFARDVLGGGPGTLGLLMSSSGLGAFAGTIFLAARRAGTGLAKTIHLAAIVFVAGIFTLALSRTIAISAVALFVAGFGIVVQIAAGNTILQSVVEGDKRGRVMSLFNMAFLGLAPIGNLMAGAVACRIGVPLTVMLGGAVCLIGTLRFAGRLKLSKIYA